MSVIFTRAPLRLSLGGGGTDLPSYYKEYGGFLIAAAINKYVYMLTHTAFQKRYRLKYSQFEEIDDVEDIKHPLLREALKRYWRGNPLEIASVADIPAGTGMGSSGAFTVCLLKALALGQRKTITTRDLAECACDIEINVLNEPSGKQDQYVAAYGGICSYTFEPNGNVKVEPLNISEETMNDIADRMLLFYTGSTRKAGSILADQDQKTRSNDKKMVENLHRTKGIGIESKSLLEEGELKQLAVLMDEHWQNKRKRSDGMSSDRVDELYDVAKKSGAVGGKLVGAGGAGFLLVYSEDPRRTRSAMKDLKAPEVRFDIDYQGCIGTEYH